MVALELPVRRTGSIVSNNLQIGKAEMAQKAGERSRHDGGKGAAPNCDREGVQ